MKGVLSKRMSSVEESGANFLEINPNKKSKLSEELKIVKNESEPRIHKVEASSVLDRVKSFLPMISKANKDLDIEVSQGNSEKYDIENIKETESVIEMDLSVVPNACGSKNLPPAIQDLLSPDESSDSDSSEGEPVSEVKTKKDLIEEL